MNFMTHNPDVLDCIANLSNDEVFTPPKLAAAMLDQLAIAWAADNDGGDIWQNPHVTFLDPVTKSGVFLREITHRLVNGLASAIPDLQERVNHILTRQVFGIAITELTGMLARRSVYCSKRADSKHSICTAFDNAQGHVWFERTEHAWAGGKAEHRVHPTTGDDLTIYVNRRCTYCGAGEADYNRGESLETHAYAFIHTDHIHQRVHEIFGADMQFDVVIGNPPYQLSDGSGGGGTSAVPIYQNFVEQAKKLEPRYLTMVIPSRWFSGGKGLDEFRATMLADRRIRSLDDFVNASDVFSGIGLKGGVCYFLWNRDNEGPCEIKTHFRDREVQTSLRPMLENGSDVFIRFHHGVSILRKVVAHETGEHSSLSLPAPKKFESLVSARKPFGLASTYKGSTSGQKDSAKLYQKGDSGFVQASELQDSRGLLDSWKVFVGFAAPGTGNRDTYPHRVISTPFLGEPNSASTETYLAIGPFSSKPEAESALSYLKCRFTRFLIQMRKASQNTTRKVYGFVPVQTWDRQWTDEMLYEKYGLTEEEISFIESIVRPMEDA